MTRPMPGPPGGFTDRARLNYALLGKQITYEQYQEFGDALTRAFTARPKRLTTPECAAHEWQADAELERAAHNLDDDYYNPHRFRLRAEYERRLDEWDTWVEFTLRPHALEEA